MEKFPSLGLECRPAKSSRTQTFVEARELVEGCPKIAHQVSPQFGVSAKTMLDLELLNLRAAREGNQEGISRR